MNREEYHKKISDITKEAIDSPMLLLDIVAVLEVTKMAIQIIMHEEVRHNKVI